MVVKLVIAIVAALGFAALFAYGATSVLVGIAEQRHLDGAYVVGFVPGSGCGDPHELYLSVEDGEVLDCVQAGMGGSGRVSLPGFTRAQNEQVQALAEERGQDGLSAADQREIQERVDRILATVPPSELPYHDQWTWGSNRAWLGAGMVAVAVLGFAAIFWLSPTP